MADFYPEEYIRVGRAPERVLRWLRRRDLEPRVRLVAEQPGRRVLDVGCATGEFLDAMRAAGWIVAGVEPAPWAADRALARGLPVWRATLRRSALPQASFDVVTMWDVIEHLSDPRDDLAAVRRALRPDGRLILTTPVLDGWEARRFGRRWPGWDAPRHLLVFDRSSLERLLDSAGFRILCWSWKSESYLISAMHVGLIGREVLPRRMADAVWATVHARPARMLAAPIFRWLDRAAGGCWITVVAARTAEQVLPPP